MAARKLGSYCGVAAYFVATCSYIGITTFAGKTGSWGDSDVTGAAARFGQPAGIACDAAGNVYVTD